MKQTTSNRHPIVHKVQTGLMIGALGMGSALAAPSESTDSVTIYSRMQPGAVAPETYRPTAGRNYGGQVPGYAIVRHDRPYDLERGVEEQRVNVIIDLSSPPQEWTRLGHGYQLETLIVLSEQPDALKLPLTALFRDGGRWAVYVSEQGRARLRHLHVHARP